jgi:protoheme IX farnesyltransferase
LIDSKLRTYYLLMKPGILVLLVIESVTAMFVAVGPKINPGALVTLIVVGILASGGSASVNQYLERGRDALMSRTDSRPLVRNSIPPNHALVFGTTLISASILLSYFALNAITALMVSLGALSYIFLYTIYLKPRTKWNIVIGGVAGIFPALAGYAAGSGFVGWPALFIGGLVFLWTPPHFWGLSMKYKDDYQKTGFPMLSVLLSEDQVIHWIVYSSIPLFVFSLLPLAFRFLGTFDTGYYIVALALALIFIVVDVQMWRHPSSDTGFRAFLISLPYLFVLFGAMIASSLLI